VTIHSCCEYTQKIVANTAITNSLQWSARSFRLLHIFLIPILRKI